jgi:UDP-glucuronate 4-epimerase
MALILVTGAAGFIGSSVSRALLARGDSVLGVDNLNAYYDVTLKEARLARLSAEKNFSFRKLDIADRDNMLKLAAEFPANGRHHSPGGAGGRAPFPDRPLYLCHGPM